MLDSAPKIELLYFNDCPSWKNALEVLNAVLDKFEIKKNVSIIQVETHEEAQKHKFTGSPTIRINGQDLYPIEQTQYALGCRMYQTPDGFRGWPTQAMLEESIGALSIVK